MEKLTLCFRDYEDYPFNELQSILKKTIIDKNEYAKFFLAINEAVGNAIRYKKEPKDKNLVYLKLYVTSHYLMVRIVSNTVGGNSLKLKNKLLSLEKEANWTDNFKKNLGGGGYWLILEGASVVHIDQNIHTVYLFKDFNVIDVDKTPKHLISKLHLLPNNEKWDGEIGE